MTGGADKDAYVWRAGDEDAGVDTVVGFFVDTNGISSDMLDLSQLLTGLSGTPDGNELDDYLTFDFTTTAGSTVITVDKNGADGGGSSDQTIVLDNVDLSTYYGSNAADVINGMLDDNALKVA
ncbi:type I secretion C-terminal target domain-containing protein [Pseudomonas anguilliseptica]|nr:type I secretion C-terminal target domain-containing protein [Pseudomonas anguilliseptica]